MRALLPLICSLPLLATPSHADAAPPTRYVALVDFSVERDSALDPAWAPWDTALQQAARQLETQSAYADKQLRFCIINNTTLERLSNKSTSPDADKDGIPHCRINAANLAAAAPEGDPVSRYARAFGSVCDAFGSIHPSTAARCRAFSPRAATPAPLPPPAAPPPPAKPLTDYFEYAPGSAIDDFLAVSHAPSGPRQGPADRPAPVSRSVSVVKPTTPQSRPTPDGKTAPPASPAPLIASCSAAHRGDAQCSVVDAPGRRQTAVQLWRSLLTTPEYLDLRTAAIEIPFSTDAPVSGQPTEIGIQWLYGNQVLPPPQKQRIGIPNHSYDLSAEYSASINKNKISTFPDTLRIDLNDSHVPPNIRVEVPLPISSRPADATAPTEIWRVPVDLTPSWRFNAPRSVLRKWLVGGFYTLGLGLGLATLATTLAGRCLPDRPANYDCAGYILDPRPAEYTAFRWAGGTLGGVLCGLATLFLVLPVQVRAKPVRVRLDSRPLEQGPSR